MLAAFYSVPTSLFRIYGGVLSDRSGAQAVPYWTFGVGIVSTSMLSHPPTTIIDGIRKPIRFSTHLGLTKRGGRDRNPYLIQDPALLNFSSGCTSNCRRKDIPRRARRHAASERACRFCQHRPGKCLSSWIQTGIAFRASLSRLRTSNARCGGGPSQSLSGIKAEGAHRGAAERLRDGRHSYAELLQVAQMDVPALKEKSLDCVCTNRVASARYF